MFSVAIALAASTASKHHVDWTAVTALTALFSSIAAILVALFNPLIGYTKARLETLTDKLEKLYQLVKEENRTGSETTIHYRGNIPTKTDESRELQKPSEEFRKFTDGTVEIEVIAELFFPRLRSCIAECQARRHRFVYRWYELYNHGINEDRLKELVTAEMDVINGYGLIEGNTKIEAKALSSKQTATGLINTTLGELIRIFRKRSR
jgi:hypothetical protein